MSCRFSRPSGSRATCTASPSTATSCTTSFLPIEKITGSSLMFTNARSTFSTGSGSPAIFGIAADDQVVHHHPAAGQHLHVDLARRHRAAQLGRQLGQLGVLAAVDDVLQRQQAPDHRQQHHADQRAEDNQDDPPRAPGARGFKSGRVRHLDPTIGPDAGATDQMLTRSATPMSRIIGGMEKSWSPTRKLVHAEAELALAGAVADGHERLEAQVGQQQQRVVEPGDVTSRRRSCPASTA